MTWIHSTQSMASRSLCPPRSSASSENRRRCDSAASTSVRRSEPPRRSCIARSLLVSGPRPYRDRVQRGVAADGGRLVLELEQSAGGAQVPDPRSRDPHPHGSPLLAEEQDCTLP